MHQQPKSTDQNTPSSVDGGQSSLASMTTPETNTLLPWMERIGHVISRLGELREGRGGWVAQLNMLDEAGIATKSVREQVDAHLAKEADIRILVENNLEVLGKFGELPTESLATVGLDTHVSQMVYSLQRHTEKFSDEHQVLELIFSAR